MSFELKNKKRIIIKIGSALLIKGESIRDVWLDSLAKDIKLLREMGLDVVLVSSGSIALGKHHLKTKKTNLTLQEKQAAASIGQISLMSAYKTCFAKYGLNVSQILLTGGEANNRERYLNASNTFATLLQNNIIPIVNENDSVTVQEIKIGDNDRLAARVAQMVGADLLILLSDIDGLYDKNPNLHQDAKFIPQVNKIDRSIENMASQANSDIGTGGMITKIKAAQMAFNAGCDVVISKGIINSPIKALIDGAKHTIFKSNTKKISSRKAWIVDAMNPKGEIIINQCAVEALEKGSSLLPVGVVKVSGNFILGDQVLVKDENGNHIATGLSNYSKKEAKLIIGNKTSEIKKLLPNAENLKDELIHRDNLVVLTTKK
ncbi:MAG: glutamate 5-kinase [Proteobacteria bacterium]|nr:glutamate 5-kinase [Pseudomonadota bacterium]